ncbi:MAG: hypothetical protein O3B31_13750, partial [Chloroflexi bacterium]|nr:hypothetical protein [Chloroflexota bacterium]
YHTAGVRRGTASSNFHTARDNPGATASGAILFRGTDPVALETMTDGDHVIVIADSTGVVACGVIPAATAAPAATGNAGLAGSGGREPAALALVGLAIAFVLALGARRVTAHRPR